MRLGLLAVAAITFTACTQSAPVIDESAVRKDAAEAFQAYVKALNEGDLETARAFYGDGEGFHWLEKKQIAHEAGKDAAAALSDYTAGEGKAVMMIEDLRVAAMGPDAAYISAKYKFTVFLPGGGFFEVPGWMITGMVRHEDGWKIASGAVID